MLSGIEVTDVDIDEIEMLLGDIKFDNERRAILKCLDTVDIQAFPGSGKTTILIAKLAILAKKWPYANKGICVLSHTNVAREEIEKRLGNTDFGKKLLSYPHFIGTFHSFFDTFIGLPWLRTNGYSIKSIDTESVLSRRFKRLSYGTKSYLDYHGLSKYACESISFPAIIDIGCKETAKSYKDIISCVEQSFQDGYFTFDEILHVSEYAIMQCKYLPDAMQNRFPVLFVDEAQDTSQLQWGLLNSCFSDLNASIRQDFGDANQAIYQSYGSGGENDIFPSKGYLTISNSHRFGKSIAHLVDSLGVKVQGIRGEFSTFSNLDGKHSVFLFDDIADVLPAYAEHILSCFSDSAIGGNLPCYAVGMVHNKVSGSPTDTKYPVGIGDYWTAYNPDVAKATYSPQKFIEFFQKGLYLFNQTGDYYRLVECVAEGLGKCIRQHVESVSNSGRAFNCLINFLPANQVNAFRSDLSVLVKLPIDTEGLWKSVASAAKTLLKNYFGIDNVEPAFFAWNDNCNIAESDSSTETASNIFAYKSGTGRNVSIHLSSIHAVKGQTHLATLLLDTHWHNRNIMSILPWLSGSPNKKPSQRDLTRLKCHYVALTRARGLICIAAPKTSISPEGKGLLQVAGWNVVDL